VQLALFVFVHAMGVMGMRLITKRSSPSTHEDPTYIKLFNRIITNTIEQSFIFLILLAYLVYDGPGISSLTELSR
jgi:hypothetical protein